MNSRIFLHSICTIQGHMLKFQTFSNFICYFSCFVWFFLRWMTLKLKSTASELWNGWKLAWYHNFTHIACAKNLRGLQEKLDALRVQTGQSLSKYQGVRRKLIYYKGISFFWTYCNSRLFLHSICTIQSHIITFQPFIDFICYFSCISWFILS